jgi:hypothetical protein
LDSVHSETGTPGAMHGSLGVQMQLAPATMTSAPLGFGY